MGLPQIMINFTNAGATAVRRSQRGRVAIIAPGVSGTMAFTSFGQAEGKVDSASKRLLELCFMGVPSRVTVVPCGEDIDAALTLAETHSAGGWICAPALAPATVVSFVKARRAAGAPVKAVVANASAPDCEGIVNFCASSLRILDGEDDAEISAADYICRIAGVLAGIGLAQSATFYPLDELVSFDVDETPDESIDAGKLIIYRSQTGPRLGRAVTSLVTAAGGAGPELKKIKIAEAVDIIKSDIKNTFEQEYIGKVVNDYDSKLLLCSAITGYLAGLAGTVLDRTYDNRAYVDFDAQRAFLLSRGVDTDSMSDTEILAANTASHVFLGAKVRFVDAMEDFTFSVIM